MKTSMVLLVVLVLACASCERVDTAYPSTRDAQADGAIDRGWVPSQLPPSARDIREWHDLDTNRGFGRVTIDAADGAWVRQHYRPIPPETQLVVRERSGDPDWWPRPLYGTLDRTMLQARGISLFQAQGFSFAMDPSIQTLFFWHDGS